MWKEGTATPLFTSGYTSEYYTCGCWSPSRPAVLYLANQVRSGQPSHRRATRLHEGEGLG